MSSLRSGEAPPTKVAGIEATKAKYTGDLIFIPFAYNGLGEKALISRNTQFKLQIWNAGNNRFEDVSPKQYTKSVKEGERLVIPNGIKAVISPSPFVQIEIQPIKNTNLPEDKHIGLLVKYNVEPEENRILLDQGLPSIDLRDVGTFVLATMPRASNLTTTQSK